MQTYTRQVRDDSSGFEHVFVGESDVSPAPSPSLALVFYMGTGPARLAGGHRPCLIADRTQSRLLQEGKIKGFHNWIQFSNLERKGQVDYKGYIFPRVRA